MRPARCAARSLKSPMPSRRESGIKVEAKYGASGTLRDEIAGGARAQVFASANMEHPQSLANAGKSSPVVLFARNRLCALVRPGLAVTPDDAAGAHAARRREDRHLDAESRSVRRLCFRSVRQGRGVKTGSRKTLEQKALQLTGGPSSARARGPQRLWLARRGRPRRHLPHLLHRRAGRRSARIPGSRLWRCRRHLRSAPTTA